MRLNRSYLIPERETGIGPATLSQQKEFQSTSQVIEKLFSDAKSFKLIDVAPPPDQLGRKKGMTTDQRKQQRRQQRYYLRNTTSTWLENMFDDENALREKMSLFWHGAVTCRSQMGFSGQDYVNTLRKNALGKFGDLIREVSKTPAMMVYLDTVKNKKGSPNENFARELMELFTLGKGHYTEQDIKEAARAFTGWSLAPPDGFRMNENQHDNGTKTIFGKTGNFDGDDVITMILENKQTAKNVTRKIYRYFVNDKTNDDRVNDLAGRFYQSNYDISKLMKDIFSSEWFYDEENIGVRIKSPIELIAGITRQFNLQYENMNSLQVPQRIMGQELMMPPNVAGWPGGKNWIDSSSLVYRMNFGNSLFGQSAYDLDPKIQPEEMFITNAGARAKIIDPASTWSNYSGQFTGSSNADVLESLKEYLIQPTLTIDAHDLIPSMPEMGKNEFVQKASLRLVSTPEYQMC